MADKNFECVITIKDINGGDDVHVSGKVSPDITIKAGEELPKSAALKVYTDIMAHLLGNRSQEHG